MTKQNWMGIIVGILLAGNVNGQAGRLEWHRSVELPSPQGESMHLGIAGPVVGMSNGYLLIGGGANFPDLPPWKGGVKKIQKEVFAYVKDGETLRCVAQDSLAEPIAYGASLSLPIGVFVIGGETSEGKTNACRLIQCNADTEQISTVNYPDLPFPLANMGAVAIENKLFVAGGEGQDTVSDQVLQLDLNDLEKGWICIGKLPYAVSHVQLLADKQANLYLVGGRRANKDAPSTLYQGLFSSVDGGKYWAKLPKIPFKAAAAVSCILPDNGLWLLSADHGDTFHRVETLIAEAKKTSDPQKAQQLIASKNQLQVKHPGFGRAVWRYDLKLKEWNQMGELPADGPVTTTAVVWDNMVIVPSGEIKAGVRTPQILIAEFLKE